MEEIKEKKAKRKYAYLDRHEALIEIVEEQGSRINRLENSQILSHIVLGLLVIYSIIDFLYLN